VAVEIVAESAAPGGAQEARVLFLQPRDELAAMIGAQIRQAPRLHRQKAEAPGKGDGRRLAGWGLVEIAGGKGARRPAKLRLETRDGAAFCVVLHTRPPGMGCPARVRPRPIGGISWRDFHPQLVEKPIAKPWRTGV